MNKAVIQRIALFMAMLIGWSVCLWKHQRQKIKLMLPHILRLSTSMKKKLTDTRQNQERLTLSLLKMQIKKILFVSIEENINYLQLCKRKIKILSGIIVPKSQNKIIKNIYVHGLYNKNANAAWFDGIALKKEPAQTYKYDKEGNNAWSV